MSLVVAAVAVVVLVAVPFTAGFIIGWLVGE